MRKHISTLVLCLFIVLAITSQSMGKEKKFEGTTKEDLAKITLPTPSQTKVAILPFYAPIKKEHVKYSTEAAFKVFEEQGFVMLPQEEVNSAFENDKKKEEGEPLTKEDALRIGKSVGADWIIYGKVLDLSTYMKQTFWSALKKAKVSLKISILDAKTQEIFFWRQGSDVVEGGMGVFVKKGAALEKEAVYVFTKKLLKDLFIQIKGE
jgi:hypothetical protein